MEIVQLILTVALVSACSFALALAATRLALGVVFALARVHGSEPRR